MVQIGVSGSFLDPGWRLIGDMVQIGVSGSFWTQDCDMVQNRRIRQFFGRRIVIWSKIGISGSFWTQEGG